MKVYLFSKISVVVLSLALLAGCGTAPVRNVESAAITGEISMANIEKAISRAGANLGWVMKKKSDGHIVGKLTLRKHRAVVDIKYNKNSYSIKYVKSENLKYSNGKIHSNYNGWIQNLENAINIQLSIL